MISSSAILPEMVTEEQERRLHELAAVFLEENAKLNLSAFRTPEQCWIGNILDSLAFLELFHRFPLPACPEPCRRASRLLLDLGTGGGFPLLPLAICLQEASLTGLDATRKKADAVERIAERLRLPNVRILCGRAEELGRDSAHRGHYDVVTVRAVAPISIALEYAAPFAKTGGRVVLWKSLRIETELQESLLARAELSCHLTDKHEYELPGGFGRRQLLVFEKTFATDGKYPRGIGIPKKHSLA